jgi:hypothetical protein
MTRQSATGEGHHRDADEDARSQRQLRPFAGVRPVAAPMYLSP